MTQTFVGEHSHMTIGFIGLGVMGQPMALNLARAGHQLIVWSRTAASCEALRHAGARVAADPAEVVAQAPIVVTMLFDSTAIDQVLRSDRVLAAVRNRTVISMSSVAPEYSRALGADIESAGGGYVEAPVSGSRVPAEAGQLVAMLAGHEPLCESVRPVLAPMCREAIYCGPAGNGLLMKLAVNIFMVVSAGGLAEAAHFADRNGLPLDRLQAVLDVGQMASQLSRIKMAKLRDRDFTRQGSIADGVNNTRLIVAAAEQAGASARLISVCRDLFQEAFDLGYGTDDMIAMIRAIEARSARPSP
jgi:3-hydroxyisobutyrate dehydrogenase